MAEDMAMPDFGSLLGQAQAMMAASAEAAEEVVEGQAGGGVVYDSDPESEFQESCNKARALIRAAQEAVRFAAGTGSRNR